MFSTYTISESRQSSQRDVSPAHVPLHPLLLHRGVNYLTMCHPDVQNVTERSYFNESPKKIVICNSAGSSRCTCPVLHPIPSSHVQQSLSRPGSLLSVEVASSSPAPRECPRTLPCARPHDRLYRKCHTWTGRRQEVWTLTHAARAPSPGRFTLECLRGRLWRNRHVYYSLGRGSE